MITPLINQLLIPLILVLFVLLAYPIATALWITLQDKTIGMASRFIWLCISA